MFNKPYDQRLRCWRELRNSIESSVSPFDDVKEFWQTAPVGRPCADPYDSDTWPSPWELIHENVYCEFLQLLAICYTLQLTDRFSRSQFEIHITLDNKENDIKYVLFVDNQAIRYYSDSNVDSDHLVCQMRHTLTPQGH